MKGHLNPHSINIREKMIVRSMELVTITCDLKKDPWKIVVLSTDGACCSATFSQANGDFPLLAVVKMF